MLVSVYQFAGAASRSVARALKVAEVEVEELPEDQVAFARDYDGDFLEVEEIDYVG